jgi:exosome complex RNA-binding protein Rrp42 (RNase PH superfamily)
MSQDEYDAQAQNVIPCLWEVYHFHVHSVFSSRRFTTFSPCCQILTIRSHFLPDPTALETPLLPTTVVIALDEKNKACLVRQDGMGGMKGCKGEQVIGEAWVAAEKRVRELRSILDESTQ